jgi:predicted nucleic acid-binding protein
VRAVFLDTLHLRALLDARDSWHSSASELDCQEQRPRVTTQLVLLELLNTFSNHRKLRLVTAEWCDETLIDPATIVIPMTDILFKKALHLYRNRADKDWSLTDCASFVTMWEFGITDALTADHHFVQAGFKALLLD